MSRDSLPKPVLPTIGMGMIVRDAERTISKLLLSVAPIRMDPTGVPVGAVGLVNQIVFVDTGSTDATKAIIAGHFKTTWEPGKVIDLPSPAPGNTCRILFLEKPWTDDFSEARNFSFAPLSTRWKMFLDADDWIEKPLDFFGSLYHSLSEIETKNPHVSGILFGYDYDFMDPGTTLRAVKCRYPGLPDPTPGEWSWSDPIHERLTPDGDEIPNGHIAKLKGHVVKHHYKTTAQKEAALQRNARIARAALTELDASGEVRPKYRARLLRTLAYECKSGSRVRRATGYKRLEGFWKQYRDYPEGRQAASDLFRLMIERAEYARELRLGTAESRYLLAAEEWAKKLSPLYRGLAKYYQGDKPAALRYFRLASDDNGTMPESTWIERIMAPYAYADCLVASGAESDKILAEKVLESVEPQFRLDYVAKPVADRVRAVLNPITIYVPGTPSPFDEHTPYETHLGGSEEAVVYLSKELAKRGRTVRVYAPMPWRVGRHKTDGVEWIPHTDFRAASEHGTLAVWRAPSLALPQYNLKETPYKKSLWLHDCAATDIPPGPLHARTTNQTMSVFEKSGGVVVLSKHHEEAIRRDGFNGKMIVAANGIDKAQFPRLSGPELRRKPASLIYSSSPDRGLVTLFRIWPKILARFPDATLDVYYSWAWARELQPDLIKYLEGQLPTLSGVKYHGGVGQTTLNQAMRRASIWAYPCLGAAETSCITAMKMLANGTYPVTALAGALPETLGPWGHRVAFPGGLGAASFLKQAPMQMQEQFEADFLAAVLDRIQQGVSAKERLDMQEWALKTHSWKEVAKVFDRLWTFEPQDIRQPQQRPTRKKHVDRPSHSSVRAAPVLRVLDSGVPGSGGSGPPPLGRLGEGDRLPDAEPAGNGRVPEGERGAGV